MFGLNTMNKIHPLDNLITDDSLWLLEAIVAFVDYPYKRMLVMLIKYKELMSILNTLNDRNYISSCGFDCHPKSTEDMLSDICKFMPGDFSSSLKNMNKMMNMMNVMNTMKDSPMGDLNDADNKVPPDSEHKYESFNSDYEKASRYYDEFINKAMENDNPTNNSKASDKSSNDNSESLYDSVLNILDNNENH